VLANPWPSLLIQPMQSGKSASCAPESPVATSSSLAADFASRSCLMFEVKCLSV